MLAKKDKNPRVIFEDSGITENRYICEGKIWNASTLITYCKEQKYPVFKLPLVGIDLSHLPWDIECLDDFIFHSLRIQRADTKYPIILDSYGRICDGYHRICKAILENKTEIDAIRIQKCLNQMDMKNDRKDDKTRWELMPLDCLEDIARVYTEGAKKYDDNTWQNLENGYERYKGALLRHLYAAESEIFDEETGCRHLAQVAWNAIALLWISKHREGDIAPEAARKQKLIDDFWEVMDAYNEIIKADCDAISSKEQKYMFTDKQINKAIKKCPLDNIKIYYREIFNYDGKAEESKDRDGRFVYTLEAQYKGDPVLRSNLLRRELINFLKNAVEEIEYERNKHRRETGPDINESTSNSTVSETDTTGHES